MAAQTIHARASRKLAKTVAEALAAFEDILAVCLVGSTARGNADWQSDLT